MEPGIINILTKKRYVIALTCLVSLLLILGAYLYYSYEIKSIRRETHAELKTISQMKANQIKNWNNERIEDIKSLSKDKIFIQEIDDLVKHPNRNADKLISEQISLIYVNKIYNNILICSKAGKVLTSYNPETTQLDPLAVDFVKRAVKEREICSTDLYYSLSNKKILLDYIAPIITKNNIVLATVLFRVEPDSYLYKLIHEPFSNLKSLEIFLVRKQRDSVLYISPMGVNNELALILKEPLAKTELPAVQAVLGHKGYIEGEDYAGQKVLGYTNSIEGTGWFIVSKVNEGNIYAELHNNLIIIIAFTILLIFILSTGLFLLYHYRQKNIFKELFIKEKELREYHEEFRTILYSIGDGVITTDFAGKIKQMNYPAEEMTGWNEKDAIGEKLANIFKIINEKTREAAENPVEKVLREGTVVGLANHTMLISKEGTEIPIADSGAPIRNEKGEIEGVVLVFRDKSAEYHAEQTLRKSEEKFRKAFMTSPDSININGLKNGEYISINHGFTKIMGYTEDEIIGKTSIDLNIWANPEDRKKLVEGLIKEGVVENLEARFRSKNGEIKDGLMSASIIELNGVPHIISITRDITERRRLEKILEESEKKFRILYEYSPLAYQSLDCKANLIDVNPEWLSVMQYKKEEVIGHNFTEFMTKESAELVKTRLPRFIDNGEIHDAEFEMVKKDGNKITVSYEGKIGKDELGHFRQTHCIFTDITARRRAEIALRESEEKLRSIFNASPEAISISDITTGKLIEINSSYEKIFNCRREDTIGRSSIEIGIWVDTEDRKSLVNKFNKFGYYDNEEIRFISKDKNIIYCLVSGRTVLIDNKKYMLAIVKDVTELLKSRQALQESEERFRNIFENTPIGYYQTTKEGKILIANPALLDLLGFDSLEELEQRDLTKEGYEPDYPREKFIQLLEEKGEIRNMESRWKHKNGRTIIVNEYAKAIRGSDGKILYYIGSVEDITSRKQAEFALQESEERFRSLFQKSKAIMLLIDVENDGKIIDANNAACEFYGYSRKDFIENKRSYDINIDTKDDVQQRFQNTLKGGQNYLTIKHKLSDGEIVDVEVYATIITIKGKNLIFSIIHDITEEKRILAENIKKETELENYRRHLEDLVEERTLELKISEERFKKLADVSKDSILRFDGKHRILYANPIVEQHWNMRLNEMVGKTPIELGLPEEFAKNRDAAIDKVFASGEENRIEILLPAGKWIDWYLVPELNLQNEVETVLGFGRDITEIKKLQENIEKAFEREKELNQMKTNFLSFASHEFRTPLTAIQSTADLLRLFGRNWDEEKYQRNIVQINTSVDEMTHMLDQVLIINRAERGKLKFQPEKIRLKPIVEEVIDGVSLMQNYNHEIRVDYNSSDVELLLDGTLVKGVLQNLISNAVKYSPSGGVIKIVINKIKDNLQFNIEDNGMGIPGDDLRNIFEPFHRGSNVGYIEGTGLGLAIVKQMVELHGGQIKVNSKINKGTKFTFTIKI